MGPIIDTFAVASFVIIVPPYWGPYPSCLGPFAFAIVTVTASTSHTSSIAANHPCLGRQLGILAVASATNPCPVEGARPWALAALMPERPVLATERLLRHQLRFRVLERSHHPLAMAPALVMHQSYLEFYLF